MMHSGSHKNIALFSIGALVACHIVWVTSCSQLFADESLDLNAVVKISSKNRSISLTSPWRKQSPLSVSGTGVLIGPGRVLTGAHVVLNSSEISLQFPESSEQIPAKLTVIAPGIDLALLEFEPNESLKLIRPLELADKSPAVQSTVQVHGYPTGGAAQSVTKGIVSRIEYTRYRFGAQGMRLQIDAALNHGNSGGPAVADNKIVGIAFSVRANANDIGYVIPVEEIRKFLDDVEDGVYDGKPRFNVHFQYLENKSLRNSLKVPDEVRGVLCGGVQEQPNSPLQAGDIVTKLGEFSLDNRGNCRLPTGLTLQFTQLAVELAQDNAVPVTVFRDGHELQLSVPLETREPLIDYIVGGFPRYFVYGPVVFSEATADYLAMFDEAAALTDANQRRAMSMVATLMQQSQSPLLERRNEYRDNDSNEELVVVSKLLSHETSRGYRPVVYLLTLKSLNGQPIQNFSRLVELLRDNRDDYIELKFYDSFAETIVLDRQAVVEATDSILEDNGIFRQGSPDLLQVWQSQP